MSVLHLELVDVSIVANEIASAVACREITPYPRLCVDLEGAGVIIIITAGIERDELVTLEFAAYPRRQQNPCMGERLGCDLLDIDMDAVRSEVWALCASGII